MQKIVTLLGRDGDRLRMTKESWQQIVTWLGLQDKDQRFLVFDDEGAYEAGNVLLAVAGAVGDEKPIKITILEVMENKVKKRDKEGLMEVINFIMAGRFCVRSGMLMNIEEEEQP